MQQLEGVEHGGGERVATQASFVVETGYGEHLKIATYVSTRTSCTEQVYQNEHEGCTAHSIKCRALYCMLSY